MDNESLEAIASSISEPLDDINKALTRLSPKPRSKYITFQWVCPECGHANVGSADIFEKATFKMDYMYCDSENGGCDERFVFDYTINIEPRIFKLTENKE